AAGLRAALPRTSERELAMHDQTFVGQADTIARIERSLGEPARAQAPAMPAAQPAAGAPVGEVDAILTDLQKMLAHELRMQPADIDADDPFVDLGLDSITGVTWIRSINEKYGTEIEAITVYSHPTLTQLAAFVRDQAGAG